jgi:arylsulfatase A-like enzyme
LRTYLLNSIPTLSIWLQGFANIGYNNKTVLTPRTDELAADGVILGQYYVQPVCSPTRSVLMTGRYTYRLGTQATVIRADVPYAVPLTETFMSQNLKDAGYATALYGKWHLGFYKRAYTPLNRGFDEHMGYFEGAIDYYDHTGGAYDGLVGGVDWHRGNETACFSDNGTYVTELLVPEAVAYLEKRAKTPKDPFFLWLPFHLIHGPNQVHYHIC